MTDILPGAEPFSPELAAKLAAAVARHAPGWEPRTHHRVGARPRFTNRLALETSPYLQQHAHNPVSWFPWGEEAFAEAKRLGRPVLVSVGYSTCHWCHVMEEESFEDLEIAELMNAHYVCIKVDREERPDVDAIYMSAVQALTGQGGWPMNVWLDHEKRPFFGGTYFPPRDGARGARRGFLSILGELYAVWQREPERAGAAARSIAQAVKSDLEGQASPGARPGPEAITAAVEYYKRSFDDAEGGLRRAPKFPSNLPVRLLLRHHRRTGDAVALHMATLTLEKMAGGGMYDQLGGGFHRYSTDGHWLVPHFEKMLYDNALLAVAYAEAYQVTKRPDFARVTREILDYVLREMTSPEGGFYSATDADSEGEEGRFFVWTPREIQGVLGDEALAKRFDAHYGVTDGGNFEGRNILHVAQPSEDAWAALAPARARLYAVRQKRVPPLRDEKILAAWNGLMISALAVGGRILGEPRYLEGARKAATFVLGKMREGGRLRRAYKDGPGKQDGFLDDHAFLVAGLIDLHEATFEPRWLEEALALGHETERVFADAAHGGWFMTGEHHEKLLAREKPAWDGAEPSGTSVAMLNALRLAAFTGDDAWRSVADRAFSAYGGALHDRPMVLSEMLLALDQRTDAVREVVLVWPKGAARPAELEKVLRDSFLPSKALTGAEDGEGIAALAKLAPIAEDKHALSGKATAYVCERGTCQLPTSDPAVLARQLAAIVPYR